MKLIKQKYGDHHITHAYIFTRPVVLAWFIKFFKGKPFVISEQWSGYVSEKFEKKNFFEKTLTRFLSKKASAVITVSEFLKRGMISNGIKGNFHVIPNVIETDSTSADKKKNEDIIKILSVADLVDEIKNISGTIKAVAGIVKNDPRVKLDIVGGGDDREKLEQLAAELTLLNKHVFFHGMKTNREVYQYLHQCDFLIMNSRFETFSSICAEAMSCGKPVIATRCGGPDEFVIPATGILIEPGNQRELETAVKNMIENYHNYDAHQIKKYATEKFNADEIGKQFFEIYKSILS
jgi:glycosyltransferase involved in cell wall biosynthesis